MSAPVPDPTAADASLHLLVDHLVDALESEQIEPCLLHVGELNAEGYELGVLPLKGRHPTDDLLGFTAPSGWHALGLATHGWAYHAAERDDPRRHRDRVHVVTLVSRTGEHAHRTRITGRGALERRLAAEPPGGEQIDLLRRALGLATDPPPCDASVYWSVAWLAALMHSDSDPPGSWDDVVQRHPALGLFSAEMLVGERDLLDVLTGFHRVGTWSRLRLLTSESAFRAPGLRAEHADWLDDGAFARYVLNRCPPLGTLRARVRRELPTDLATRVLDTLDRLGVPTSAWPDDATGPPPAA